MQFCKSEYNSARSEVHDIINYISSCSDDIKSDENKLNYIFTSN
jgi:hypothetical protein